MAFLVVNGALLQCSFGSAPGSMIVPPKEPVMADAPAATIMDNIPATNIPPFGSCNTPSNPAVAAATSAALGVLTPQPCVPATAAPWVPGATAVIIGTFPALNDSSTCICSYGGVIKVNFAGQTAVEVE